MLCLEEHIFSQLNYQQAENAVTNFAAIISASAQLLILIPENKISLNMKKVIAALTLALVTAVIVKKVRSGKKRKATSKYLHHLHTGAREEAYFKKNKKSGGKKTQYA